MTTITVVYSNFSQYLLAKNRSSIVTKYPCVEDQFSFLLCNVIFVDECHCRAFTFRVNCMPENVRSTEREI